MNDPAIEVICKQCGGRNPTDAAKCWLCGTPLGSDASPVVLEVVPESLPQSLPPGAQPGPTQFSLTTLIVAVTLCAMFFGLLREAPGAAFGIIIWVLPALALTHRNMNRRRARGETITTTQRVVGFFVSVFMVWAISTVTLIAIAAALVAVCLAMLGAPTFR
jgi:hypothetical protein